MSATLSEHERREAREGLVTAGSLVGPATIFVAAGLLVPIAILFRYSLNELGPYKQMIEAVTAANYVRFFSDPYYTAVLARTLRVALTCMLACLLLHEPQIVLLDEPASGLTGSEIDEIDLVVRKLSQEYGVAVLLIEHRLELLAMVASRVLVLDVGRIIAEGPPETVFLDETVRQAYFDVPIDAARYGDLNLDLEDA